MKRIVGMAFGAAALSAFSLPVLAQTQLVIPPPGAPGVIADENQARAALSRDGVRDLGQVALVGDYWEGQGVVNGQPVTAYLFSNGGFETQPALPDDSFLEGSD